MKSFKEKVQSMTGKEIVMAMVNGLQKEWVKVDMSTFGDSNTDTCFGCAATNSICQIEGCLPFNTESIVDRDRRASVLNVDEDFLSDFENAIDFLRRGDVYLYNARARRIGIAELPSTCDLPDLVTKKYKRQLQAYIDYANTL